MKAKDDAALSPTARQWLGLQQSLLNRVADYMEGVGQLAAANDLEPKRWINGYAQLWSAVIGDVGDWLATESNLALRPTAEWVCRGRTSISAGTRSATIGIEVPSQAFGTPPHQLDRITLVTDGFSRGGRQVAIAPKDRVRFVPDQLTRSSRRRSEVKFFNLPLLQKGLYSGMVCAEETDLTVAIVELEVI